MTYDLLIKNGRIVDGTGLPSHVADVAVKDGRIAGVGAHGRTPDGAKRVIDADGLVVAPGFIDVHTHYDAQFLWDPLATASCYHGVTTVVMTNCGFAMAPVKPKDRDYMMRMFGRVEAIPYPALVSGLTWEWESYDDYLKCIDGRLGINAATQIGHSTIRRFVMGEAARERAATEDEVKAMQDLVRLGMEAGAVGFTTSYGQNHVDDTGAPVPSRLSTHEETLALASVLGEYGRGVIEINPRTQSRGFEPAERQLMVRMARESGRPVVWGELNYRWDAPELITQVIGFMEEAERKDGVPVYALMRCQRNEREFKLLSTSWFDTLGDAWRGLMYAPVPERQKRLQDPALREELRAEAEYRRGVKGGAKRRWDGFVIQRVNKPQHKPLEGKDVATLAREMNKSVADVILDVAKAEDFDVEVNYQGTTDADEQAMGALLRHPHMIMGVSDGGAHVTGNCSMDYPTWLLGHWVRERQAFGLEEAVRMLTLVPAAIYGIKGRGLIREGYAADFAIFDPKTVRSLPVEELHDYPGQSVRRVKRSEGVRYTVVNGQVLLQDNKPTGALPGKLLRNGG